MTQRSILENSISLMNTLRGPAKILFAPVTLAMPVRAEQVIDPTLGAPASGWTAIGLTRGGINVTKTIDTNVRSDVDQIIGAYAQDISDRGYTVTTQMAEILNQAMRAIVWEMGVPTQVSTTGATQVMTPLDDGDNVMTPRRMAVVWPKPANGKVLMQVFRWAELTSGDKALRYDKADPASPPLELRVFPEIASYISQDQEYGVEFDIV